MSASLISGYTGLLENPQVTTVCRILGIPIQTGATVYGREGFGGPTETTSFVVQRDALFTAVKALQSDAQTEGEVFKLLARWDLALQDMASPDPDVRSGVAARKRQIADELRAIYPIFRSEGCGECVEGR